MKKLKKQEDFSKILDLQKEEISRLSDEDRNQIIGGYMQAATDITDLGMCICNPTRMCHTAMNCDPIPFPF